MINIIKDSGFQTIDIDVYLNLLCSNDPDVRITAIVDIISNHIPRDYPQEFIELMDKFKASPDYYASFPNSKYPDYHQALRSFEQISGLYLQRRIDNITSELMNLTDELHQLKNAIKNSAEEVRYKLSQISDTHIRDDNNPF